MSQPNSSDAKPAQGLRENTPTMNTPVAAGGTPQLTYFGYRERIGPHGEFILYQPTIEELMRERQGNVPPLPPIPPPRIPRGKWQGYGEYIGPNGEFVLYQPTIEELMKQNGDEPPPANAPQGGIKETVPEAPPKPANKPVSSGASDHPHTVAKPGPATYPMPNPNEPIPTPPPDDDVDGEMRRHHEWLKHRFVPKKLPPIKTPKLKKPDPNAPGTYKKLRDEADETAARIRALEQERYDSWLSDDMWDWLFGQELRLLLVHLRAIRWQIEEFEKAYANGDDPVAAVNKYNRQQWEIFLNALNEHIQLLGGAIMGIEAIRSFQRLMEEALEAANAARQRKAGDWLRTRERARLEAKKAAGSTGGEPGGGEPPATNPSTGPTGGVPPTGARRIGGLTQREWNNVINRNHVKSLEGTPEYEEARLARLREFSQDVSNGQIIGTATRQADGSVDVMYGFNYNLEGDELVFDGPYIDHIPADEVPAGLQFDANGNTEISIYIEGPR